MKKKILVLLAIVGVLAAMIPGQASALTLQQRVAKIEAKLNCLRYAGLSEFGEHTWYYNNDFEISAASFDTAMGLPHSSGDFRVLVVHSTRACRLKFQPSPDTYLPDATTQRVQMLQLEKIRLH